MDFELGFGDEGFFRARRGDLGVLTAPLPTSMEEVAEVRDREMGGLGFMKLRVLGFDENGDGSGVKRLMETMAEF